MLAVHSSSVSTRIRRGKTEFVSGLKQDNSAITSVTFLHYASSRTMVLINAAGKWDGL
jgi:hypothetical protein